jgi:hypothetical protein
VTALKVEVLGTYFYFHKGGTPFGDTFEGDSNDRTFVASLGADRYIGGDGIEVLDYGSLNLGLTFDEVTGTLTKGTTATADHLQSIESLLFGSGDDTYIFAYSGQVTLVEGGTHFSATP